MFVGDNNGLDNTEEKYEVSLTVQLRPRNSGIIRYPREGEAKLNLKTTR